MHSNSVENCYNRDDVKLINMEVSKTNIQFWYYAIIQRSTDETNITHREYNY